MSDFEQDPNGRFVVRFHACVHRRMVPNTRGRLVPRWFVSLNGSAVGDPKGYNTYKRAWAVAQQSSYTDRIPVGFDPFNV